MGEWVWPEFSITGGEGGLAAAIGYAMDRSACQVDNDRVGIALNSTKLDPVTALNRRCAGLFGPVHPRAFESQDVGEPWMMGPRSVHGRGGSRLNSRTFRTTQSVVLGMVRPPGDPVTSRTRPASITIVGDCELSIRLPPAITFAGVPIRPD